MKKFVLVLLIASYYCILNAQISGILSVGPAGDYEGIDAAVNDIISLGLNGNTILELKDGYEYNGIVYLEAYPGDSEYSLTIRPEEGATNIIFSNSGAFVFRFDSTHNVIIDGRPGGVGNEGVFTIEHTFTGNGSGIYLNETTNSEVRYCNIGFDSNRGISLLNSNLTIIENCNLYTYSLGPNSNGATYGISISKSANTVAKNNIIHDLHVDTEKYITGLYNYNATIENSVDSFYNNFITIITNTLDSIYYARGLDIKDYTGSIKYVYHNTMYMAGDGIVENATRGVECDITGEMNMYNNISINKHSITTESAVHSCISIEAKDTATLNIDYNLYFTDNDSRVIGEYMETADTTLNDWQTAAGFDAHSVSKNVEFSDINSGDLHLSGSSFTDTDIYGLFINIPLDIDGDQRYVDSTYIGADQPFIPEEVSRIYDAEKNSEIFMVYSMSNQLVIQFHLEKFEYIDIRLFDISGRYITSLINQKLKDGDHTFCFEKESELLKPGIYIIQFHKQDYKESRKIFL